MTAPLLALILLSGLARAADAPPSDPGYWSKTYSFPAAYATMTVALTTGPADWRALYAVMDDADASLASGLSSAPGACSSWLAPARSAERLAWRLSSVKNLSLEKRSDGRPFPEYPELALKRRALSDEADALRRRLKAEELPAVRALLDTELAALDRFLALQSAARDAVRIDLFQPTADGTAAGRANCPLWAPSRPPDPRLRNFWSRSAGDADCGSAPVVVDVRLRPRDASGAGSLLRGIAADFRSPPLSCSYPPGDYVQIAIPPSRDAELRAALRRAGDIELWNRRENPRSSLPAYGVAFAARKRDLLQAELNAHPGALDASPYISAFIRGELDRLGRCAADADQLQGWELVRVSLSR